MTDNEIIKALEICGDEQNDYCYGCPYFVEDGICTGFNVNRSSFLEVLDLINRQKAEIEELYKLLDKKILDIKAQETEIERLNELVAENEKAFNKMTELYNRAFNRCRKIKSEAIKEFAERLKSEIYTVGFDIDNLVKEMVGE